MTKRQVMALIDSTADAGNLSDAFSYGKYRQRGNEIVGKTKFQRRQDILDGEVKPASFDDMGRAMKQINAEAKAKLELLGKVSKKRHWKWADSEFPPEELAGWHKLKRQLEDRERAICRSVLETRDGFADMPLYMQVRAEDGAIEAVRRRIDSTVFGRIGERGYHSLTKALLVFTSIGEGLIVWSTGKELLEAAKKDIVVVGAVIVAIPIALIVKLAHNLIKHSRKLYAVGVEFEGAIFNALEETIGESRKKKE